MKVSIAVVLYAFASHVCAVEAPPEVDPTLNQRGSFYSGCIRWPKHDFLTIQSARLSAGGRTLALDIADMRRSHQLQFHFKVRTADGAPIERIIYLAVPVLAQP